MPAYELTDSDCQRWGPLRVAASHTASPTGLGGRSRLRPLWVGPGSSSGRAYRGLGEAVEVLTL